MLISGLYKQGDMLIHTGAHTHTPTHTERQYIQNDPPKQASSLTHIIFHLNLSMYYKPSIAQSYLIKA